MPDRVVTASGETVYTRDDIQAGREVWQSLGGMQLGSVWGHGGYVAPDWGADWLHREATTLLDIWARAQGARDYAALDFEAQAAPVSLATKKSPQIHRGTSPKAFLDETPGSSASRR